MSSELLRSKVTAFFHPALFSVSSSESWSKRGKPKFRPWNTTGTGIAPALVCTGWAAAGQGQLKADSSSAPRQQRLEAKRTLGVWRKAASAPEAKSNSRVDGRFKAEVKSLLCFK